MQTRLGHLLGPQEAGSVRVGRGGPFSWRVGSGCGAPPDTAEVQDSADPRGMAGLHMAISACHQHAWAPASKKYFLGNQWCQSQGWGLRTQTGTCPPGA